MRSVSHLLLLASGALACSYVEVAVPDRHAPNRTKYVIARSNELGNDLQLINYVTRVHPRGEGGGRYGYVSVDGHEAAGPVGKIWVVVDGLNEAGFSMGCQTLRESVYEGLFPQDPSKDVLAQALVGTLLQNVGTVDEALDWLSEHRVVGPGGLVGFHWALADASGRSVVVEYLRGQRVVYENTPRVMTNDPPLDWHWRNLNTYVNLSPDQPHQNDFLAVDTAVGSVPKTTGHGWNLAGLPGDSSAASRYAQLFYLRGYAARDGPPKSSDDGVVLASGLLNKVFIPLGTVAHASSPIDMPEYTPFAVVKIPFERRILVRGYRNLRWKEVDLSRADFTKKLSWPVEDGSLGVEDLLASGATLEENAVEV